MTISEELEIYLDVSKRDQQNFASQIEMAIKTGKIQYESALKRKISGEVTENVIREHLRAHRVNVSERQVYITGMRKQDKPIDLVSFKEGFNEAGSWFKPEVVDAVIEITNTGVSDKSGTINAKFDKVKKVAGNVRFCVIVLSERDSYINTVTERKLEKDYGCRVFTLLGRERYINPFDWSQNMIIAEYNRKTDKGVSAIRETGDWSRALDFFLHK
jgi:hypothetical protein